MNKSNQLQKMQGLEHPYKLTIKPDSLLKTVPKIFTSAKNKLDWREQIFPLYDGPQGDLIESLDFYDLPFPYLGFSSTNTLDVQKSSLMRKENFKTMANPVIVSCDELCLVRERSVKMPLLTGLVPRYKYICKFFIFFDFLYFKKFILYLYF